MRITAIIAVADYFMLLIYTYFMPALSPQVEAIVDVILMALTTTPLIYFGVINPYNVATNTLIKRMNNLALQDELTHLGNRRALLDYFNRFLSVNIRQNSYGVALSLDLDKFKEINDTYGHDAGDAVLIETAKRLTTVVRKEDIVCRVGGDEFIILLSIIDIDSAVALQKGVLVAERILTLLEKPFEFNQYQLQVSTSIGLKLIVPEPQSIDEVLKDADIAMYHAKQLSGQKIIVFEQKTD